MAWAEKDHKDYLAPTPKLLEIINSKLLKVVNSKLVEVDCYLTVSLFSGRKSETSRILPSDESKVCCSSQEFKKPPEVVGTWCYFGSL